VDVKSDGGLVVAPPSNHLDGFYSWANDLPIAKAPAWLLDKLALDDPLRDDPQRESVYTIHEKNTSLRRAEAYAKASEPAIEGGRNSKAFSIAGHCFSFGGDVTEIEVFDFMSRHWNPRCTPPLDERELFACIESAKKNGKPREPKPDRPHERNGHGSNGKPDQNIATDAVLLCAADVVPEQTEWLWQNLLPIGSLVDIQGDPGNGKSTLLIDIAARITRGDALPFEIVVSGARRPRGVIIMTAEDSTKKTVVPRLIAAKADLSRVYFLPAVTVVGEEGAKAVTLPIDVPAIERAVESVDAALLIIDPYEAHVADDINTNSNVDNRRCLSPVARMAEQTGCTPATIRHLNKREGQSALHRASGSIGIVAAARAVFAVGPDPDDPSLRILACSKSNLGPMPDSLKYKIEEVEVPTPKGPAVTSRVVWLGTSGLTANDLLAKPDKDCGKLEEAVAVIETLLSSGPRTSDDVEAACKQAEVSKRTYWRARKKLGIKATRTGYGEEGGWVLALPKAAN
jgi:hypothetical protein